MENITKDLYLCSPLLNTECSKENCYINNGSCCHTVIKEHSQQYLLDCITNLQEENERLKEIVENLTTMTASGDRKQIKNTAQFKLDICKQRIDKAIKELETLLPLCIMPNNTLIHATEKLKTINKTLKILKGE